jgi:hypothetical protein
MPRYYDMVRWWRMKDKLTFLRVHSLNLVWKGINAWLEVLISDSSLLFHLDTSIAGLFSLYFVQQTRILYPNKMMFTAGLVALVAAPMAFAQRGGGSFLVGSSLCSKPFRVLKLTANRRARLPSIPRIRCCCCPNWPMSRI